MTWRSVDGGKSWSDGKAINDVPGAAREGLHGMAAGGRNTLFVTWLDLREKGTRLYGSVSFDDGATWSRNHLVYESPSGTVCQCCHPSAAVDVEGLIYVMFRNSLAGNRDMYLVRSEDGGKTFGPAAKLGAGSWELNACPMDGGSLAVDTRGEPFSVWRRAEGVFFSTGPGAEESLGDGQQPVLALSRRGPVSAWTDGKLLKVRIPGRGEAMTMDADAAYPSIVTLPEGPVLLAWEQSGVIVVKSVEPGR